MHTIVYASSAWNLVSEERLLRLLQKCRDNNAKFGVTGLLLYQDGSFMQAIEGDEVELRQLYANIHADSMHHHVLTLLDEPIEERAFPEWPMGFVHVRNGMMTDMPGFSNVFHKPDYWRELTERPSDATRILASFRRLGM